MRSNSPLTSLIFFQAVIAFCLFSFRGYLLQKVSNPARGFKVLEAEAEAGDGSKDGAKDILGRGTLGFSRLLIPPLALLLLFERLKLFHYTPFQLILQLPLEIPCLKISQLLLFFCFEVPVRLLISYHHLSFHLQQ